MKRKVKPANMKIAQWYKMEALFDGVSKEVAKVDDDKSVILKGVKYRAKIACSKCGHVINVDNLSVEDGIEDKLSLMPELALCVVPRSMGEEAGERLRLMLEANLRMPVLLLSDNVHLVKLKPIRESLAKAIFSGDDKGILGEVIYDGNKDGEGEEVAEVEDGPEEGDRLREADSEEDEGSLRLARSPGVDGEGEGSEGPEDASETPVAEHGEARGAEEDGD